MIRPYSTKKTNYGTDVYVVSTIEERDTLTELTEGVMCIVEDTDTFIYTGTEWKNIAETKASKPDLEDLELIAWLN
jgi:hypothetical protein